MLRTIISPLFILLSLFTTAGVFLHETKIDKLTTLAIVSPAKAAKKLSGGKLLESMPHTHSDSGTFESSSRELRTQSHGMAPRRDRDEKYRLQKYTPRGFHLFDSYYLPLDGLTK